MMIVTQHERLHQKQVICCENNKHVGKRILIKASVSSLCKKNNPSVDEFKEFLHHYITQKQF